MYDLLKRAEDHLPQLMGDLSRWSSSMSRSGSAYMLSAWRPFGPTEHHIVLQLLSGDHSAKLNACRPYIARVVKGTCGYFQAVDFDKGLEQVCSGELASGSVFYMEDPDGWHSLRPIKRDVLLARVSKIASGNDYYAGNDMDPKHLAWLLNQFRPSYE